MRFSVRELDQETWPAFGKLVEKHNGIWDGTVTMFSGAGFSQIARLGRSKVLMKKTVRRQR